MKKSKRVFTIIFSFFLFFFLVFYHQAAYAAPYGSGTYGSGVYGAASTPTSAPGSASNSNSNSSSNTSSAPSCGDQAPSSAPNLFQINTTNTTALLYFAPAGMPYNNYYVSFGNGKLDEGYGASFNQGQTGGVISYTVFQLKPNTIYTFKVRGGNGCAPGAWSKNLTAKTTSSKNIVKKYYPLSFISYLTTYSIPKLVNNVKNIIPFIANPTPVKVQPATGIKNVIPAAPQTTTITPTAAPKKKTCFFFICW